MSSVRAEAILTALVLAGTAGVATDYIDGLIFAHAGGNVMNE